MFLLMLKFPGGGHGSHQPLGPGIGAGREEFVGKLGGPMGPEGRPRDGRGRGSQWLAEMEQGGGRLGRTLGFLAHASCGGSVLKSTVAELQLKGGTNPRCLGLF